jgi:single-strand DNA-binding protein
MVDINRVVLVGRLTKEAELKYTGGGQAVCKFSVAVNRRRKKGDQYEDEANFFDVVLWGVQGESLSKYLVKGKLVGIDGELRQDRWQQDGQNRSKVEIVASSVQLLGGGSGNEQSGGQSGSGTKGSWQPKSGAASTSGENAAPPSDDEFTDDIPF